ncbi:hypothetical protein CGERO_10180 [Corynebacterium gerontici]|uniref:Mannosyltransferase (PIG-V) n=1 Tax=Corynebacterium gerontici TaxID=2079234 RepID=A0A3G6J2M8_9CORY|nr:hypothetical protein CGERO_10180 [Corynebacterium gerontici]
MLFALTALLRLGLLLAMNPQHAVDYLGKWDGEQYSEIARFGYFSPDGVRPADPDTYAQRLAFFPGFPALIRCCYWLLHWIPSVTYVGVGVGIACVAGILATWGFMRLALPARPSASALLLLGAPMAITMQMAYTESLFMACAFWALVFMRGRRLLPAAILVAASGFLRLTAVDLWLVFAALILVYQRKTFRNWLLLIASALPFVAYILWASAHSRDLGGYFGLQKRGWNSGVDFGKATVEWIFTWHSNFGYIISSVVMVGAAVAVVLGAWWVYRGHLEWFVWFFGAAITANVLLSDGIMHSRPRLLLPAIVLLIPLARRIPTWGMLAWTLAGVLVSAYMVGIFTWAI